MKLALFGLLALFSLATALKIHAPKHIQNATEAPAAGTEVKIISI